MRRPVQSLVMAFAKGAAALAVLYSVFQYAYAQNLDKLTLELQEPVRTIEFSPDGKFIAVGTTSRVLIFRISGSSTFSSPTAVLPVGNVVSIAFTPYAQTQAPPLIVILASGTSSPVSLTAWQFDPRNGDIIGPFGIVDQVTNSTTVKCSNRFEQSQLLDGLVAGVIFTGTAVSTSGLGGVSLIFYGRNSFFNLIVPSNNDFIRVNSLDSSPAQSDPDNALRLLAIAAEPPQGGNAISPLRIAPFSPVFSSSSPDDPRITGTTARSVSFSPNLDLGLSLPQGRPNQLVVCAFETQDSALTGLYSVRASGDATSQTVVVSPAILTGRPIVLQTLEQKQYNGIAADFFPNGKVFLTAGRRDLAIWAIKSTSQQPLVLDVSLLQQLLIPRSIVEAECSPSYYDITLTRTSESGYGAFAVAYSRYVELYRLSRRNTDPNNDGVVDDGDILEYIFSLNSACGNLSCGIALGGDVNGDGFVDDSDFLQIIFDIDTD